jgi:hypothetical protein
MIIMFTIVILFILILCVACIKKRGDDEEEEEDIRRQFENESESEYQEESEEEEDPITLNEEDYDKYFPIVNMEKKKVVEKLKDEICSICIDNIINNEKVRKIRFCTHYFHSGCLQDWIKVNETCPNCKLELNKTNMELLHKKEKESKSKKKKKKSGRIGLIDPTRKKKLEDTP